MKLRYDPLTICQTIATIEAKNYGLVETSPGFYIKTPQLFTEQAKEKYVKNANPATDPKRVIRIVDKCKNGGVMIIHEVEQISYKAISYKHKDLLKQGYRFNSYVKKRIVSKLFISKTGAVHLTTNKSRYLGFQTVQHFQGYPMVPELLSIQPNNAWLEPLISTSLSHIPGLTMEVVRKCSSLQEFLDVINLTDTSVKAEWFEGRSLTLKYIMDRMMEATYFTNPDEYLQTKLTDVGLKQIHYMIQICDELGIKITFDPNSLSKVKEELTIKRIDYKTQQLLSTGKAVTTLSEWDDNLF